MKEEWDLYDAKRNKTGYTLVRGKPIPAGYYHLVVSVWILNSRGEYLLSQRNPDKQYPLCWECTGGAVLAGESSLDGAVREVWEELGIELNPTKGRRIFQIRREGMQDLYDVWVFHKDISVSELTLQKTEVVDARWVTAEELMVMKQNGKLHPLLDVSNVIMTNESIYTRRIAMRDGVRIL